MLWESTVRGYCGRTLWQNTVRKQCGRKLSDNTLREHCRITLQENTVREHCQQALWETTVEEHWKNTVYLFVCTRGQENCTCFPEEFMRVILVMRVILLYEGSEGVGFVGWWMRGLQA